MRDNAPRKMVRLGMMIDGHVRTTKKEGNGPVDAISNAFAPWRSTPARPRKKPSNHRKKDVA